MGQRAPSPLHQLLGLEERCKLPSGVQGVTQIRLHSFQYRDKTFIAGSTNGYCHCNVDEFQSIATGIYQLLAARTRLLPTLSYRTQTTTVLSLLSYIKSRQCHSETFASVIRAKLTHLASINCRRSTHYSVHLLHGCSG